MIFPKGNALQTTFIGKRHEFHSCRRLGKDAAPSAGNLQRHLRQPFNIPKRKRAPHKFTGKDTSSLVLFRVGKDPAPCACDFPALASHSIFPKGNALQTNFTGKGTSSTRVVEDRKDPAPCACDFPALASHSIFPKGNALQTNFTGKGTSSTRAGLG